MSAAGPPARWCSTAASLLATPLVKLAKEAISIHPGGGSRPQPTCRVLDQLVRPIGRHELHRHFASKQRAIASLAAQRRF